MTVPLPYSVGSAISRWQVTDWLTPAKTSQPATGGTARIDFDPLPDGYQWLIDRAVVSCTSATATAVRLYDTSIGPLQLLTGSASGGFDEADYPAGLLVRSSAALVAVWTGCADGAVASCRLQVRQMQRTS